MTTGLLPGWTQRANIIELSVRHVRSQSGALYFRLPIGSPITAKQMAAAKERHHGTPPPAGAMADVTHPNAGKVAIVSGGITTHLPAGTRVFDVKKGQHAGDQLAVTEDGKATVYSAGNSFHVPDASDADIARFVQDGELQEKQIAPPDLTSHLRVTSNRTFHGTVVSNALTGEHEAFDKTGQSIGKFPDKAAARDALETPPVTKATVEAELEPLLRAGATLPSGPAGAKALAEYKALVDNWLAAPGTAGSTYSAPRLSALSDAWSAAIELQQPTDRVRAKELNDILEVARYDLPLGMSTHAMQTRVGVLQNLAIEHYVADSIKAMPIDFDKASRADRNAHMTKLGAKHVNSMPKDEQLVWLKGYYRDDFMPGLGMSDRLDMEQKAEARYNATLAKLQQSRRAKIASQQPPVPAPQPAAVVPAPGLSAVQPVIHSNSVPLSFTKLSATEQPKLDGWAEKWVVKDNNGDWWLFKPEVGIRGGVSGEYRTDMEHAAHLVANQLGFHTAESRLITNAGQRGQAQRWYPNVDADLTGVDVTDLTGQQLQNIMDEHLVDWSVANHDSHIQNLLKLHSGEIVGVDKGQAFKYFGKDRLEIGYRPDPRTQTKANPVDDIYKAIISGKIQQPQADALVKSALNRAARMSLADDQPLIDAVLEAQQNRPASTFATSAAKDAADLARLVVQRKNNLPKDFEKFYRDIYAKAGLTWSDDLTADLGSIKTAKTEGKIEGVYSGVSDHLVADAHLSGAHGVPTFFAGTDMEDGYLLTWREVDSDGSNITVSQLKTRQEADQRLVAWLAKNQGSTVASGSAASSNPRWERTSDHLYNDLLDVTKHYSHHAATGNYSPRRTTQLLALASEITSQRRVFENDKVALNRGLLTGQEFGELYGPSGTDYEGMLDHYQHQAEELDQHRANQSKPGPFAKYNFVTPIAPPPAAASVSAPTLNLKVTRGPVVIPDGEYDLKENVYKRRASRWNAGTQARWNAGTKAQGYNVEVNDRVAIDYIPWTVSNVSQQGQLRITALKADGKASDLDDAMKALREMGIEMKPAEAKDLELLYWRQLYGGLKTRNDSGGTGSSYRNAVQYTTSDTYKPVVDYVDKALQPGMSPDQEIEAYKAGFALKVDRKRLDDHDWRPVVGNTRIETPDLQTGHPYWNRPDVTKSELKANLKSKMPYHALAGGSDAHRVALSGAVTSTEDRYRMMGTPGSNRSSSSNQQSGGANYVFTSLYTDMTAGNAFSTRGGPAIQFTPDVALRTSNFYLQQMNNGQVDLRSTQSPFAMDKWANHAYNALHLKNSLSFLNDVEVASYQNQTQLDEVLNGLRKAGVTTIRGLPIEQRFVLASSAKQAADAAFAHWAGIAAPAYRPPKPRAAPAAGSMKALAAGVYRPQLVMSAIQNLPVGTDTTGLYTAFKKHLDMGASIAKNKSTDAAAVIRKIQSDTTLPTRLTYDYGLGSKKVLLPNGVDKPDLVLLQHYLNNPGDISNASVKSITAGRVETVYEGMEAILAYRIFRNAPGAVRPAKPEIQTTHIPWGSPLMDELKSVGMAR